ncbi:hypothetical protein D3C80_2054010 [compost metagenome]
MDIEVSSQNPGLIQALQIDEMQHNRHRDGHKRIDQMLAALLDSERGDLHTVGPSDIYNCYSEHD